MMQTSKSGQLRGRRRRGAMLVLICVMIFAFIVTVAFSVDIAYMHLTKAELRSSTDAAAKAAAQTLAATQDTDLALQAGKDIAAINLVAGSPLLLRDSDFELGSAEQDASGRFQFSSNGRPTNSIRVTGSRTSSSLSGPVGLFFGRVLGRRDFQPTESSIATFVERDIVLVIDRSGSMLEPSGNARTTKFRELQVAVESFIRVLQSNPTEESVGLASYSSAATQDVPLTKDLPRINAGLGRLVPAGATSISSGISAGQRIMQNSRSGRFVERTMIVMTDGLHNTGRSPIFAAQEVAAEGVTIHTITFGAGADQRGMQQVAAIGSGKHFHANNGTQLDAVFREIALTMSTIITK